MEFMKETELYESVSRKTSTCTLLRTKQLFRQFLTEFLFIGITKTIQVSLAIFFISDPTSWTPIYVRNTYDTTFLTINDK